MAVATVVVTTTVGETATDMDMDAATTAVATDMDATTGASVRRWIACSVGTA